MPAASIRLDAESRLGKLESPSVDLYCEIRVRVRMVEAGPREINLKAVDTIPCVRKAVANKIRFCFVITSDPSVVHTYFRVGTVFPLLRDDCEHCPFAFLYLHCLSTWTHRVDRDNLESVSVHCKRNRKIFTFGPTGKLRE